MKKILFVLPILACLVTGCYNPVNVIPTPVEDKSPFEYVLPNDVNIEEDYTYIGDVIFGDLMDFNKWIYTNPSLVESDDPYYGITKPVIVLEKIARVSAKYPEDSSKLIKEFNGTDNVDCLKATTYKLYIIKSIATDTEDKTLWNNPSNNTIIDVYYKPISGKYRVDGGNINIRFAITKYTIAQYDSTANLRYSLDWYE
jgi:hypothetical protein